MNKIKTIKRKIMPAVLGSIILAFFITGCPTPLDNLQAQIDSNKEDIVRIDEELDSIQSELNSIQAWMIVTDDQLANAFQLIGDNAAAITQLREDMEEADGELQDQIDDLLDLFWDKYGEVSERIDDVIEQQDEDRDRARRAFRRVLRGLAYTNLRVTQLEDAFQDAAEDFQEQIDDLRDDLEDLETALRNEIHLLAQDVEENADEIAEIWLDIADIIANYYTANQVDSLLNIIRGDIVGIRDDLDDLDIELETKITLVEAEQEVYRILFGDNAMDDNGILRPFFENQMYWNDNFQGFSRVVNSIFYQVASALNTPGHTPPSHVAQSLANALLNYFASINDLDLLEGRVAGLENNVESIEILLESLGDQYRWRGSGSLAERDELTNVEVNDVWVLVDTWLGLIVGDVQLLRYDGYAWVPIVGGSIYISERTVNGGWHSWDISDGTDYAADGFTISGNVLFSDFSSSMEMDKIYIQVRDETTNLFGAKFLANDQASQWKAEIGENLGSGPKVGTQAALWSAGIPTPFELTYDGSVLRLFVNSTEVLTYAVAGLTGGETIRITVVERTAGLDVELRDVFLNGENMGFFTH